MTEIHRGKGGGRFFGRKTPTVRGIMGSGFVQLYPKKLSTQVWVIAGITRDSTGAVLASCLVELMRSRDMTLIATQTSDGSGNFSFQVDPADKYQVIGYKPGSPDVAGITANTLIGV